MTTTPTTRTIRYKLIISIVLPVFVIYSLTAVLIMLFDMSATVKYHQQVLLERTALDAMACEKILSNAAEYAEGLSRYIEVHRPDSSESVIRHIQELLIDYPNLTGSSVVFEPNIFPGYSGHFALSMYRNKNDRNDIIHKDMTNRDFSMEEWYAKPKETGRACWTEPYFDEDGAKVLMITHSAPIFFEDKFVGVATIDMKLNDIHAEISGMMDHGNIDKKSILFSDEGKVITSPNSEWNMKETVYSLADKLDIPAFKQLKEEIADSTAQLKFYYFNSPLTGESCVSVIVPLHDTGWNLMEWQSLSAVRQPIYQRFFLRLAIFSGILVFIAGQILAVTRRMTQPIEEVVQFAQKLADGHLDAEICDIHTNNEIEQFSYTFNQMGKSLKKSIEETIQSGVKAAEAQNKAKTEFLMLASHELRTPINGILSAANLLLQTPLNAKQVELVDIQNESSILLLLLISNMLDYAKLDVEGITPQNVAFDLRDLIDQLRPLLVYRAKNRNVNIDFQLDEQIKNPVMGDATRIRQVLLNLLSNAVKFSVKDNQSGNVTLNISQIGHGSNTKIHFEVIDDGIGIVEEKQKKIFEAWQNNTSTNRHYDGFGLGLIISKAIIDALHGSIGMHSEFGKGSTFWFEVPLPHAEEETSCIIPFTAVNKPEPRTVKVLIVEDNKINQIVTQRMLENLGYETAVAANGQKAVEAWENDQFDVILMDCQMPEMDGYEAAEVIRQKEKDLSKPPIPIFALTANISPGDKEHCLASGMNAYFNKPVVPEKLVESIEFWVTKSMDQLL